MILWWSLLRLTGREAYEVERVTQAIAPDEVTLFIEGEEIGKKNDVDVSRTCASCRWAKKPLTGGTYHAKCTHPSSAHPQVDLVSGERSGKSVYCNVARSLKCTYKGIYWEGRKSIWELLRKEPKSG